MLDHYEDKDDIPHILTTRLRTDNAKDRFVFKCLLDSRGTNPMINLQCIPLSVMLEVCASTKFLTTQGKFASVHTIILQDLCLPEFSFSCSFKEVKTFVFDHAPNCPFANSIRWSSTNRLLMPLAHARDCQIVREEISCFFRTGLLHSGRSFY
jgi:hypothetical protein